MEGKIAFEEHMATEATLRDSKCFVDESGRWDDFAEELLDFDEKRLNAMDASGVEVAILSLNAPAIQAILSTEEAIRLAIEANDHLAAAVRRHPSRYMGLAALPMQHPNAASKELRRCVEELGFKGALVNGFTQRDVADSAYYYDTLEYRDFWQVVSELGVPFYLHPRMQIPQRSQIYDGHPWLRSSPWGFAVETSTHALRLCGSGLFDDFPNLKIVLGHQGEGIPFGLHRMDERMRFSARGYTGRRPLGDYFREHFYVTVSGNFNDPAFRCTIDILGVNRVCFSSDYPFERMQDAANWFDSTTVINDENRYKIGRSNAIRLFGLDLAVE